MATLLKPADNGFCDGDVLVACGGVDYDVCLGGFALEEIEVVVVAVYQSHVWKGRSDFGSFGFTTDEAGQFPFWVELSGEMQDVAADEACCSGSRSVRFVWIW